MEMLLNGDCLEMMDKIPDGSVDMVLADPPYSSGGLHTSDRQKSTRQKYTDKDEHRGAARFPSFSGDNMDQRSFTEYMRIVFTRARKKTKPEGIVAAFIDWRNLPAMTDAIQMAGWVWRGIVIWDKKSSRPQKGRFRNQCEYVVWGSNGNLPVNRDAPCLAGVYSYVNVPSSKRHHQTEKPVELMEDLLQIVPGSAVVLDPFMGSGSTGVACAHMERNFIGIELDRQYYDTAKSRIEQARVERKTQLLN